MKKQINPYKSLFSAFSELNQNITYGKINGKIATWRDPYNVGYSTTYARNIEFQPGVTVLVGCNGAGKTTLLENIKSECHKQQVAYLYFNHLQIQKTGSAMQSALNDEKLEELAQLFTASEGETITLNLASFAKDIGKMVSEDYKNATEIWLLFDATDSGLSIDNVIDIKNFFNFLLEQEKDKKLYIIISANEYELTIGEDCLDVISGKHVSFNSYEEYKAYILKSREKKDNRIQKAIEKTEKEK